MRLADEKKRQWLDRIRLRSWNSDGGNFTVKAMFLREDDQAGYLKRLNGQEVTVEKDRLSEKECVEQAVLTGADFSGCFLAGAHQQVTSRPRHGPVRI